MATYTQAQIAQIGKLFESASGGLVPAPVASAWASAEQGRNNNVFGLGASTAGVPGFASVNAAVLATWSTISNSGTYAQTLARLKAAGGNVRGAALAIAESPWRLGPSGVKAAGGVDPYYGKVFQQAGLLTSADISGGRTSGGGTWKPAAGGASSAGSTSTSSGTSLATYLGKDPSTILTMAIVGSFIDRAAADTGEKAGDISAFYADFVGKPLGQIAAPGAAYNATTFAGSQRSPDLATGVASAVVGALVPIVVPVIVLVGLLWIGKVGLEKTIG